MTATTDSPDRKETLGFQAEVRELLRLVIHSLYSNREIFLRELVSNASDACDRLRFAALARPELYGGNGELEIRIDWDPKARTVTIADNGIGMSRDEVIAHIGTIAKSGTREFLASLTGDAANDARLIGQFGVGFYSAFIVADRVTLTTRAAGLEAGAAVRWESSGEGEFTLEPVSKATRGTEVVLHLREGMDEYASRARLAAIVRRYSDHVALPIRMSRESWDAKAQAFVRTGEDETVNQASALWTRPKSEITPEQYHEFYHHVAHDAEAPLVHAHGKVEGRTSYTFLLYVPARPPYDLWDREHRRGLKLYVRRVFIMDEAQQLLPAYLRFVRGVVDADDLPLNVSRELLQESRDVETIRAGCTKRVLTLLEDLAANEPDRYAAFWREFGIVLKEGLVEDAANHDRVAKLLRFATTHADAAPVALADYVARMKSGQDAIWYVVADTPAAAAGSPHLEVFRKQGIEVLLLSDRIDEWVVGTLPEFEDKPLRSVAKGTLDVDRLTGGDADAAKALEATVAALAPALARVKAALGDRVADVRASARLTESPACLVVGEGETSVNLERILKASGHAAPAVKPVLELNPSHPLVSRLADETDAGIADWATVLYDQALLAEGAPLPDPARFVKSLNALLVGLTVSHADGGAAE